MADLRDLYQEMIIDHSRRPRNKREIADADHKAEGFNPLCGDRVTVYVKVEGDKATEVSFTGVGCSICTASASLMTEAAIGKTHAEMDALFDRFHEVVMGKVEPDSEKIGKLVGLAGVKEYPVRIKCATLPWHTLKNALDAKEDPVSTE